MYRIKTNMAFRTLLLFLGTCSYLVKALTYGGNAPRVLTQIANVTATESAFAALHQDGTVTAWGDDGGTGVPYGLNNVKTIYSNLYSFAALQYSGEIAGWGSGASVPSNLNDVTAIYSTSYAFAAMKADSSVVAWGHSNYGGYLNPSFSGCKTIFSNYYAFAALKTDGTIRTWGQPGFGGSLTFSPSGVITIFSTNYAFAALLNDGSVSCWGSSTSGGTSPTGLSGVQTIYSNSVAFVAVKDDGTLTQWGQNRGNGMPTGLTDVESIYSTDLSFAVLMNNGSVVAWGDFIDDAYDNGNVIVDHVSEIFATKKGAFAALKDDGTVEVFGSNTYGGSYYADNSISDPRYRYSGMPVGLSNVRTIFSNDGAFVALHFDGDISIWGSNGYGGYQYPALTNVSAIYSTARAFAAVNDDGALLGAWDYYTYNNYWGYDDDFWNDDGDDSTGGNGLIVLAIVLPLFFVCCCVAVALSISNGVVKTMRRPIARYPAGAPGMGRGNQQATTQRVGGGGTVSLQTMTTTSNPIQHQQQFPQPIGMQHHHPQQVYAEQPRQVVYLHTPAGSAPPPPPNSDDWALPTYDEAITQSHGGEPPSDPARAASRPTAIFTTDSIYSDDSGNF
jgi:alpha-tubulin suppressor-like RCC1 family protein